MIVKISVLVGLVFIPIWISGCASTDESIAENEDVAAAWFVEESNGQIEIGKSSGYFANMAQFWMQTQLPSKGGCASKSGDSVLYLEISSEGKVSRVHAIPIEERSQCYAEAYTGMEVPEPPVSPFFFKLEIL